MRHHPYLARRRHRPPSFWVALLASLLMVLGLTSTAAYGKGGDGPGAKAADQVLTWTAGDPIDRYLTAPKTAVAGKATIVFENSTATGNTTSMPHTLTFSVSDPEFNNDVQLNILANPGDSEGGKHSVEVTLSPGRYFYHCTIPGHGMMQGILTVTEGSGEDTEAPATSAKVDGDQNGDGAYIGQATVTVEATDEGSGVDTVEYALGADGEWQPYTAPVVVNEVGDHTVRYR
ncbi:Copper binding protein, plastocyanin/azurin family, partial [Streptomyces sp. Termitarium-T10T-6]